MLNQENCLFFIVDLQEKLINAAFNKDIIEKNSSILEKAANILNIPVLVSEQYPKGLGGTIDEIATNLDSTNTHYYEKTTFNALCVDEIKKQLMDYGKKQIVIFGIETHICVYQTTQALIEEGYEVIVIKNACGSRTPDEYTSALECMKENAAIIKTTEMVLFELLKVAKHPKFKEIQSLIK